jgi:hypothetical protein
MATSSQPVKTQSALLGFGIKTKDSAGRPVIRLRFGRILAALFAAAMMFWLSLSTALWCFTRFYQGYPEASWVAWLTFQRTAERQKFGDYQVERAMEHMERGEWNNFNLLLRTGVMRSPGNVKGRIYLAQLNSLFGRQDLTLKTYEDGIPYLRERFGNPTKEDLDFIRSYMQFLFYENRDQRYSVWPRTSSLRLRNALTSTS